MVAAGAGVEAGAMTISTTGVTPTRLSARYRFRVEDTAALAGLESAMRRDIRMVMSDALDRQIMNGTGVAPNFAGFLATPANGGLPAVVDPSAVADFTYYVGLSVAGIDGLFANSEKDCAIVVNQATYRHAATVFATNTAKSAGAYIGERLGAWYATGMIAQGSEIQEAVLARGRSKLTAVAPVWQGLTFIRDVYSDAAKGVTNITVLRVVWIFDPTPRGFPAAQSQNCVGMEQLVWSTELEIRSKGGRRTIRGSFPYNKTAVRSDRGRVRKEKFAAKAFAFAIADKSRDVNLLVGHEYGKPVASKQAGTLKLRDTNEGVEFEATLPPDESQPSWIQDLIKAADSGLVNGVSPGFKVPLGKVKNPAGRGLIDAEEFIPDKADPNVMVRKVNAAVLYELSLVTRPAYSGTKLAIRGNHDDAYEIILPRNVHLCNPYDVMLLG